MRTRRGPCLRKSSAQPPWRAKTQSDWVSRYNADGQENRWSQDSHLPERSSPRPRSCDRERQRGGIRSSLPFGPAEVRENYGFSLKELGQIKSALTADLDDLCAEWSRIHGSF